MTQMAIIIYDFNLLACECLGFIILFPCGSGITLHSWFLFESTVSIYLAWEFNLVYDVQCFVITNFYVHQKMELPFIQFLD